MNSKCSVVLLVLMWPVLAFADQPNIIFFLADDLGYGDLGCFWQDHGSTAAKKFDTPHIDQLAAEGVKLTNHYCSAPVCAPSRASLISGRHQGHCEIRDSQFDKPLPLNHNIGSVLKAAGYYTAWIGKAGLSGSESSGDWSGVNSQYLPSNPLNQGFDRFFGYHFHADGHEHYPRNGTTDKVAHIFDDFQRVDNASLDLYTTDAWTAAAKKVIIDEATDGDDQPFFLYVAYDTPHFKMQRPAVAYPPLDDDGDPNTGGIQWTKTLDSYGRVRYASTADGAGTVDGYTHPDIPAAWGTSEKQHVGMIRRIDNSIADILQTLKDLGLDDNTVVIFSSDNGPHNEGNNPRTFQSFANMEGIKRDMWEAGIREPTIVRWPAGITNATGDPNHILENGYPCANWDWLPTFAELAGIPAPAWCDGVSLVPTLTGSGVQRDKGYLYFEFQNGGSTPDWAEFPNHRGDPKGQMQCLRIGDYMGIRTAIATGSELFQIYDVTTDPGEAINLAAQMPDLQAQMQALAVTARRPGGGVSRPYDGILLPSVGNSAVDPGVDWQAFTGPFPWVPEFRDLTPYASGSATYFDPAAQAPGTDIGLLYAGYLSVPSDGAYTFYLTTDDGGDLFIHDAHVIDDDFHHDGSEVSGVILLRAGLHPFRLYYKHTSGANQLSWQWSGPGLAKEPIPAAQLSRGYDNTLDDLLVHYTMENVTTDTLINAGSLGAEFDLTRAGVGTVVPGLLGDALALNGSESLAKLDGSPIGAGEPRTTAVWVNTSTAALETLLTFGSNVAGGKWDLDVYGAGGGFVELGVGYGRTDSASFSGLTALNDGQWHHVVAVLNDELDHSGAPTLGDVELYVDGQFEYRDVAQTRLINTDVSGVFKLGAFVQDAEQQLDGVLDDLAIWSRGLSRGEIRALNLAAREETLGYNASEMQSLFKLAQVGQGQVTIGPLVWEPASGLPGVAGDVVVLSDEVMIVLDDAGNGVCAVRAQIPSHLVGYYSMDEVVGDQVVNEGSRGSSHNLPVNGNQFRIGRLGKCVMLGNPMAVSNGALITGSHPRTTAAWIRTTASSELETILTMGVNSAGAKWDFDLDTANGGYLELGVGNGRTDVSGMSGLTKLNDGQWRHVAVVLDGDQNNDGNITLADALFYVDGQFEYRYATGTQGVSTSAGGVTALGACANSTDSCQLFSGQLDDVAFWDRGLSAAELLAVYHAGSDATLPLTALQLEQLFELYQNGTGSVPAGALVWKNASGLSGAAGDYVVGGDYAASLMLNEDGSGVVLTHPADVDVDGDLEGSEAAGVFECLAGPGALASGECLAFDLNRDGDVDIVDLQLIGPCVSGSGVPVELHCAD